MYQKTCQKCENQFETEIKNKRICDKCRAENYRNYQKDYHAQYLKNPLKRIKHLVRLQSNNRSRKDKAKHCCSFPGCISTKTEKHHVEYSPEKYVYLCKQHHTFIHHELKRAVKLVQTGKILMQYITSLLQRGGKNNA